MEPNPAGIFEITFLHALHPELVQRERSLAFKGKPLTPPDNWADGQLDPSHPIWGVIGPNPRHSDPSSCKNLLNDSVRSFVQSIRGHALSSVKGVKSKKFLKILPLKKYTIDMTNNIITIIGAGTITPAPL